MAIDFLPKTTYLGLTASNIMEDLKNIIQNSPDYNKNWNDFLSSNAGRMLLELCVYAVEQLGIRIDLVAKEFFIATAKQDDSKISYIKGLSYSPQLAAGSQVAVQGTTDKVYTNNIKMPYPFFVSGTDANGTSRDYELIKVNTDGKFEYPIGPTSDGHITYFKVTNYNSRIDNLTFYEGRTVSQTYTASGLENELISITNTNIITNSIRVYKVIYNIDGSINSYEECLVVNNFLDPEAQERTTLLPCKLELQLDNTYGLRFSNKILMTSKSEFYSTSLLDFAQKLPAENDDFVIFYRIGGGLAGNLPVGNINIQKSFFDSNNQALVSISFINNLPGYYGSDAETLDEATILAPIMASTSNKTVTKDDYYNIINSLPQTFKSISYGHSNYPNATQVNTLYGGNGIKPLEVWNYIVPKVSGYNSKKTWEYNDTFKFTSKIMDNINEQLTFSTGKKNVTLAMGDIDTINLLPAPAYQRTVLLSKSLSKSFIDFTTNSLLNIGTNNSKAVNYEGNESNFEKLNIKLTDQLFESLSPSVLLYEKWDSVNSQYTYLSGSFDLTYNPAQDGYFTIEIYNEEYVKVIIQDSAAIPNTIYLHYIFPQGYFNDSPDPTKQYQYTYISGTNLYPSLFDEVGLLKVTLNKVQQRTFSNITSNLLSLTDDYNFYWDSIKEKYKLTIENKPFTKISDFTSFYSHYMIDNRGLNLNLYTNGNITANLNNFITGDDLSLKTNIRVGTTDYTEEFYNMSLYDKLYQQNSISSSSNNIINISPVGIDPGFLNTYVNKYIRMLSSTSLNDFTNPVSCTVKDFNNNEDVYVATIGTTSSGDKDMTSFEFKSLAAVGTIVGTNISITVPFGTNVSALVANYTITGIKATVGAYDQVNNISTNDFSSPVTYIITDGSLATKSYIVTVTVDATYPHDFASFSIPTFGTTAIVTKSSPTAGTIMATIPYLSVDPRSAIIGSWITTGTNTEVTLNSGSPLTSGISVMNLSSPPDTIKVRNTIDNSFTDYTVTISMAGITDKEITRFYFPEFNTDCVVTQMSKTITGVVPYGTNLQSLYPTVDITGQSILIGLQTPTPTLNTGIIRTITSVTGANQILVAPAFPISTAGQSFVIIDIPDGTTIAEKITEKIQTSITPYYKNNLRAVYDTQRDKVFFKIRELSLADNEQITFTLHNSLYGTDLAGISYLDYNDGLFVTSDDNNDGVSNTFFGTSEYYFYNQLKNKKIICLDNIFKQTFFRTFDYVGKIVYKKNFNPDDLKYLIKTEIRNVFNITKSTFGLSISKNKIESIIYSIPGVINVETDYFGENLSDTISYPTMASYSVYFDELLVVSDDRYVEGLSQGDEFLINGIKLNMFKEV